MEIHSHNLHTIENRIRNSYTFWLFFIALTLSCFLIPFPFYIPSPIAHTRLEAVLLFFPSLSLNKKALHSHRKSAQRTELIGYRSESQSRADICWDQNPKPDNLHTVWPSTQPYVCMSECYTLVSWSYLSFFHAERGRPGRRGLDMLPLCCFRPLCMWRNFWNYIIYHAANTHSHTHPVNQIHAHRHFWYMAETERYFTGPWRETVIFYLEMWYFVSPPSGFLSFCLDVDWTRAFGQLWRDWVKTARA